MLRNGSMRVTYRGAKVYSKNEEVVSPDVYNRLRKDKDVYIKYAEANEDGTYTIGYTERVKPIHNLEGYMPHFFHHFMVYEKTKGDDGKEILVSLGSANSINVVHATVAALQQLEEPEQVAKRRGKSVEEVAPAALLRARKEAAHA